MFSCKIFSLGAEWTKFCFINPHTSIQTLACFINIQSALIKKEALKLVLWGNQSIIAKPKEMFGFIAVCHVTNEESVLMWQ